VNVERTNESAKCNCVEGILPGQYFQVQLHLNPAITHNSSCHEVH